MSEEELALIQQHRQGQALVSDRRSRLRKLSPSPEPDATAAGEKPSSLAAEGGSRTEVAGACGRVAGAVATGWQAVTPLEEASNKMLPVPTGLWTLSGLQIVELHDMIKNGTAKITDGKLSAELFRMISS